MRTALALLLVLAGACGGEPPAGVYRATWACEDGRSELDGLDRVWIGVTGDRDLVVWGSSASPSPPWEGEVVHEADIDGECASAKDDFGGYSLCSDDDGVTAAAHVPFGGNPCTVTLTR